MATTSPEYSQLSGALWQCLEGMLRAAGDAVEGSDGWVTMFGLAGPATTAEDTPRAPEAAAFTAAGP